MILQELENLMSIGCSKMNKLYTDIRVCEFGNQKMNINNFRTGKQYLLAKGVLEHVSIDLNGRNGALRLNLAEPIEKWKNYFDMVTNYGTTEHVSNQYQVFKNIHNFVKPGGVMIHTIPIVGGWAGHCNFRYEPWFLENLAKDSNYDVVVSEIRVVISNNKDRTELDRSMVCAVLLKEEDSLFMAEEKFNDKNGIKYKK
jgi:SAM-dependent methyltransferase